MLLPEGIAINLGFKQYAAGDDLKEALIGRQGIMKKNPSGPARMSVPLILHAKVIFSNWRMNHRQG